MTSVLKVDTIQNSSGGAATTDALGIKAITEADMWRVSQNQTGITSQVDVTNWERHDTYGAGQLGTGMTESSGVFTFPSTGIWLIQCQLYVQAKSGTISYFEAYLNVTTNNSTYNAPVALITGSIADEHYGGVAGSYIFDVEDTTTHKFKLRVAAPSSSTLHGDSSQTRSGLTFIRLGAT